MVKVWGSEASEGADVVEVRDAGESDMVDARKSLKMAVAKIAKSSCGRMRRSKMARKFGFLTKRSLR